MPWNWSLLHIRNTYVWIDFLDVKTHKTLNVHIEGCSIGIWYAVKTVPLKVEMMRAGLPQNLGDKIPRYFPDFPDTFL